MCICLYNLVLTRIIIGLFFLILYIQENWVILGRKFSIP